MTTTPPTLIRDPWRRIWRFATSDALLGVILISLALWLATSTWLPQTPPNDPVAYSRWLSETQQQFGNVTTPLITLGLFSITQSILFRLTLGALAFCCAVRLLNQIDYVRAIDAVPAAPLQPLVDQTLDLDLATAQAQLRGYVFRSRDDVRVAPATMIVADRYPRRSIIAELMLYGGALIILAGLVLGTFVDERADGLVVEPDSTTTISGTAYAIRLDALHDNRAVITVLPPTGPATQSDIARQQPFVGSGPAIYLDSIGPALVITATDDISGPLNLQRAADDPLQPVKFAAFTPDRSETFIAAPGIGIVLQIALVNPDQYNVQAYQSASGKVLAGGVVAPGSTLVVSHTVFSFQPSAFITVSAVNQPSHWLIIPAWLVALLGLLGVLFWPRQRVWLRASEHQTRVIAGDAAFDRSALDPAAAKAKRRGRRWLTGLLWLAGTMWLGVSVVTIYPRVALLTRDINWLLGLWLLLSGSILAPRVRIQAALIGAGVVITLVSLILI